MVLDCFGSLLPSSNTWFQNYFSFIFLLNCLAEKPVIFPEGIELSSNKCKADATIIGRRHTCSILLGNSSTKHMRMAWRREIGSVSLCESGTAEETEPVSLRGPGFACTPFPCPCSVLAFYVFSTWRRHVALVFLD